MSGKRIPYESLIDLRRRLNIFPPRTGERRLIMQETANLHGVSEVTLYRALREHSKPKPLRRADYGQPRIMSGKEMERYCEIIAAIKIRTSNKKGRHLSTPESIRLLEDFGVDTPDGFVKAPKSFLKQTTINRYLKLWGYDYATLRRQPPAVRFQAEHSNQCWHFDLSQSDLKHVKKPSWIKEEKGNPLLMLYSVIDDRSGVAYQEYHCVYGEDVGAALRFLFNAMSPKKTDGFSFCGIPQMIYMDNGPIARSHVFQEVMKYLGVEIRTHVPAGKDGRRVTARATGKGERPFRTVKELHETLYHFHEPESDEEANAWLMIFLIRYNNMEHRSESHSRMEDWVLNHPETGIREMCSWERFCTFSRESERRKVGIDARVSADGIFYEVDPDLAGEEVILRWGIFDNELYVEHGEKRYGPFVPVGGPIPLNHYRKFRKTKTQQRADRIEALAEKLVLSKSALSGNNLSDLYIEESDIPPIPFSDPDPYHEFTFSNSIMAKKAIAEYLGMPLAKLPAEQLQQIDLIISETLNKSQVIEKVKNYFNHTIGKLNVK